MPSPTPDDAALNRPGRLGRELVGLIKAVAEAEAAREARLQEKLGDLDRRIAEVERVRTLIAGGAARREARLRAIEDTVEAMAEERSRAITPTAARPAEAKPLRRVGRRHALGRAGPQPRLIPDGSSISP